jgi:hypothetical protein
MFTKGTQDWFWMPKSQSKYRSTIMKLIVCIIFVKTQATTVS